MAVIAPAFQVPDVGPVETEEEQRKRLEAIARRCIVRNARSPEDQADLLALLDLEAP